MLLICVILEAAELNIEDYIVSRTAIQDRRRSIRQERFALI